MSEYVLFYKEQIIMGSLYGAAVSILGVYVLLNRIVFFGLTLSQAAAFAMSVGVLVGKGSPLIALGVTALVMIPFYFRKESIMGAGKDAMLGTGFVFFASLSSLVLAAGGNMKTHVMAAYFGDILMIGGDDTTFMFSVLIIAMVAFGIFNRLFTAVLFDPIHATLAGLPVFIVQFLFFILLTSMVGLSVLKMGSFYTVAQLIIPGLITLKFSRSMRTAIVAAALLSSFATIAGFMISFYELPMGSETMHLPTSSTIIIVLCMLTLPGLFLNIWNAGRKSLMSF